MTVNIADVPKLIWSYFKTAVGIALVVFIALTVLKLFNVSVVNIATPDPQALGVLVAGLAYALSRL